MTEADWLASADPGPLIRYLGGRLSHRKRLLFIISCFDRARPNIYDSGVWRLLNVADRLAEGEPDPEAHITRAVIDNFSRVPSMSHYPGLLAPADRFDAAGLSIRAAEQAVPAFEWLAERAIQADLFRDVAGNPFRPVVFDPAWRTTSVLALAAGIYADQAFHHLPVLADALEDAGCTDEAVLGHCRGPGPHARGCWVVDLVLGKT